MPRKHDFRNQNEPVKAEQGGGMNMSTVKNICEATKAGNHNKVAELTKQALDEGIEIDQILEDGFIPAMAAVGADFAEGKCYIPEMLMSARAMKTGMEVLKPMLVGVKIKTFAKVVLGTVEGDMHDIGKNLVGMMLEGSGVEVIDLGVDVSPAQFIEATKTHEPDFLALSALLTTTMITMEETIKALKEAGLRDQVKVLFGGAPVSQKFADEIGADGYGANVGEAMNIIKELMT
jgi:5-methyltetrahydrofolate--homocysteine methyltransferase